MMTAKADKAEKYSFQRLSESFHKVCFRSPLTMLGRHVMIALWSGVISYQPLPGLSDS